ncbi:MAG: coproporphyrinogen-III oxidase family protein, partial [Mangrovibacterium sp.]
VSFARELLGAGINRLSIGIQSFGNQDLKNMNRRHDAARALACIDAVREAGFTNLSIDLIYGLPGQDLAAWEENVNKAVGLKADHVSAYHLTYHKGTVFYNYLKRGKIKEIPDELSFAQFNKLRELLVDAGYEHYEISNFARDKQYSKHNRSYWERKNYLGFGPSAHSFDQHTRRWNISNLKKYLSAVENDQVFWKTEVLSEQDQYNDFMITSLRTMWGISQQELEEAFQVKYSHHFRKEAVPFMETGHMLFDGTCYTLSEKGLFISDTIMEKLLFVESA